MCHVHVHGAGTFPHIKCRAVCKQAANKRLVDVAASQVRCGRVSVLGSMYVHMHVPSSNHERCAPSPGKQRLTRCDTPFDLSVAASLPHLCVVRHMCLCVLL